MLISHFSDSETRKYKKRIKDMKTNIDKEKRKQKLAKEGNILQKTAYALKPLGVAATTTGGIVAGLTGVAALDALNTKIIDKQGKEWGTELDRLNTIANVKRMDNHKQAIKKLKSDIGKDTKDKLDALDRMGKVKEKDLPKLTGTKVDKRYSNLNPSEITKRREEILKKGWDKYQKQLKRITRNTNLKLGLGKVSTTAKVIKSAIPLSLKGTVKNPATLLILGATGLLGGANAVQELQARKKFSPLFGGSILTKQGFNQYQKGRLSLSNVKSHLRKGRPVKGHQRKFNEESDLVYFARRIGSKDRKKRKKRLPGRNQPGLNVGAAALGLGVTLPLGILLRKSAYKLAKQGKSLDSQTVKAIGDQMLYGGVLSGGIPLGIAVKDRYNNRKKDRETRLYETIKRL